MKKLLSVILCLTMLVSFSSVMASASDELIINVANDLHYALESEKANFPTIDENNPYVHVSSSGQLYYESKAVISAFLDSAAKDESTVVLLPGDLTDDGTKAEHQNLTAILKAFEASTGKKIFVVPGNHDVMKTTSAEFMAYYADFGYSEAIAKDTLSASYVAELSDEYRLLAIDSTVPAEGKCGIDSARAQWIRQQAEKAKAEGKKMIAMLHHNLLNHFIFIDIINSGSVVDKTLGLCDIFAENGVKYTFTGHTHEHDIASYNGENGEVIYDAVTSSLSSYPCQYRKVTFSDSVKIETKRVEKVDTALVPRNMSAEAFELMSADFVEYSKKCVFLGVEKNINNSFLTPARLKALLKINASTEPELCALFDKVTPKLKDAMNMPLYTKDEIQAGMSIESIIKPYGVNLPESKYQDVMEVALTVYESHVAGDENFRAYSNEVVLASKGIGGMLMYALSDVTAEEYAMALGFVCKLLDVDLSADLLILAGDQIKRFEGIELVVSTAILPLILKVTVDDAPADCDVTLPGYAQLIEPDEAEKTFWDKVQEFFIKIFSFFMSLFAFTF